MANTVAQKSKIKALRDALWGGAANVFKSVLNVDVNGEPAAAEVSSALVNASTIGYVSDLPATTDYAVGTLAFKATGKAFIIVSADGSAKTWSEITLTPVVS